MEKINKLRFFLKNLLNGPQGRQSVYEAIHALLIVLCQYWPLNTDNEGRPQCPLTCELISEDNSVLTSEGYQYQAGEGLKGFFRSSQANNTLHPINKVPIIERDRSYMLSQSGEPLLNNTSSDRALRYAGFGFFLGLILSLLIVIAFAILVIMSILPPSYVLALIVTVGSELCLMSLGAAIGYTIGYFVDKLKNAQDRSNDKLNPKAVFLLKAIKEAVPEEKPQLVYDLKSEAKETINSRDFKTSTETSIKDSILPRGEVQPRERQFPDQRLQWLNKIEPTLKKKKPLEEKMRSSTYAKSGT